MKINARIAALLTLAVAVWVGCDSRPKYEHATVRGKVTFDGKPVKYGSVLFVPVETPQDGAVRPASGSIAPDGTYELKSEADAGAILGDHKVVVIAVDGGKIEAGSAGNAAPAPAPGPSDGMRKAAGRFKSLIPQKYSDPAKSPLIKKVESGINTIDIELTN